MKHFGKRSLCWLLALALAITLLPAAVGTASAAGEVASIVSGGTETAYTSLGDAVNAWAEGTTLKLLEDFNLSSGTLSVTTAKNVTLDLNGHTFSTAANPALYMEAGSLTVTDSSTGGVIVSTGGYGAYVYGGSLILESGTIRGATLGVVNVGGSVALNGGTVDTVNHGGQACVYNAAGSLAVDGCTVGAAGEAIGIYAAGGAVTVDDGTILAYDSAIYGAQNGTAVVSVHGGTIGSAATERGVYGYFSSISMDGGSVAASLVAISAYGGTLDISGTAAVNYAGTNCAIELNNEVTATISGGTITANNGYGVYVCNFQNASQGKKTLNVTGGTITAAHAAISSNGTANEEIEINISGGTIQGGEAAVYSPNAGETVNISGTAVLTGGVGVAVKGGTVNISGGTIIGTHAIAPAGAEVSGWTVTGDAVYVEDNYGHDPIVNITGGTVSSDNGYALQYYTDSTDASTATGHIEVSGGVFESSLTPTEYNSSALDNKIILSGGLYDAKPDDDNLAPDKLAVQAEGGKWTIGESYFKGYSLSLRGDIGVNCYVDLGTGTQALDPAATTITLSCNGETQSYSFSSLTPDAATGWYKFTVRVAAKEMTDTITATLSQGGVAVEVRTYSVAKYANRIIANNNGEFDSMANLDKLQTLCRSMLIYGAKAQATFGYKTDSLADAGLSYTLEEVGTLGDYGTADLSPFGASFESSSLVLETKTIHRLYLSVTEASLLNAATITCGSKTLTVQSEGGRTWVDIPDIAARNVLKNYTVTFSNGTDTAKLRVNAGAYIRNALAENDAALTAVVTALYWYSSAAEAYFTAS